MTGKPMNPGWVAPSMSTGWEIVGSVVVGMIVAWATGSSRPTDWSKSENQRLWSLPVVSSSGSVPAGSGYSVITPPPVIRPSESVPPSVNQRAPSGPVARWPPDWSRTPTIRELFDTATGRDPSDSQVVAGGTELTAP